MCMDTFVAPKNLAAGSCCHRLQSRSATTFPVAVLSNCGLGPAGATSKLLHMASYSLLAYRLRETDLET